MSSTTYKVQPQMVRRIEFSIRKAALEDIPIIRDLAAITLGEGYLTSEKLHHDLTEHIAHVAVYKHHIVGYCISECLPPGGLRQQLLGHPDDPYDDLRAADQKGALGLLQSVGVDPQFLRNGIATKMVEQGLQSLRDRGMQAIIALAWKTDTIHIGGVLTRLGFQKRQLYKAFWREESLNTFQCPVCNNPCVCDMVLFSWSTHS